MTIGSRQIIIATQGSITIKLDCSEVNKVDAVKSLGVHIDKHLSWYENQYQLLGFRTVWH